MLCCLCCVVLHCIALRCVVLCCVVLCCAVLCCIVSCRVVLCCAVLCCVVLCCAVLCCVVLCCVALRCAVLNEMVSASRLAVLTRRYNSATREHCTFQFYADRYFWKIETFFTLVKGILNAVRHIIKENFSFSMGYSQGRRRNYAAEYLWF